VIEAIIQLAYVVPVGMLVSLDVVVLTLLSLQQFRSGEKPAVWSATHALVHASFLAIGIGLFTLIMRGVHAVFSALAPWLDARLREFADWVQRVAAKISEFVLPALRWLIDNLPLVPELLAIVLSVGLCFILYRSKIAAAAGAESEDIGFSRVFRILGPRFYAASIVAMDMWYLTPTLRNIISQMETWTKFVFVALLFLVVFSTVISATRLFSKELIERSKEGVILATLLAVVLIVLEPIGVFYFAFYAAWKVVHPETEHHVLFLVASAALTWLMIRGKLLGIVRVQLARVRETARKESASEA
jgi:hypothetical protein